MLRWLLGGRDVQEPVEKSLVLCIGDEQIQNPYTELQVLKGHSDIVRFMARIDDLRFASAGDDGVVFVWNVQTGERIHELRGHSRPITAIAVFPSVHHLPPENRQLLTASSDKTVIIWDLHTGSQIYSLTEFQSSVKCLMIIERLDVWLSGADKVCTWNCQAELLCKTTCFKDADVSSMIELPKNSIATAVRKDIVIFKLTPLSSESQTWEIIEMRRLSNHEDDIRALISVNDNTFATGSHVGELIIWDSLDWSVRASESQFWNSAQQSDKPAEIKISLTSNQHETCIHHLSSDRENVFAAIGTGIYVYNLQTKTVIAYQQVAHDSRVLHIAKLPNNQLVSCSEDGSVRLWELQELPPAEPATSGLFSMWGIGRPNKQQNQMAKRKLECSVLKTLELTGDLIGHSGAVRMFLYFEGHGMVTCSTDHLVILWKDGERESKLRSKALFQKLEREEQYDA
ncbi:WD repeat-containing protein 41 isoform X1 [Hemiscyllium ocellatum]|uniref:WD repeat-containing protein 41 isoform X1 n=1 Tax=Hemiscyllium ocellatum TaxID=170820 RepID=UPI00296622AA|nr:WD repeat-containing protein 41 isoform X1 [Hemiscyllium ocellatum]XP_060699598.1 WD repeat-containing protein 41 isoform X1 [Hemiscyllium ocellatum]